jgi:hypothetical protein
MRNPRFSTAHGGVIAAMTVPVSTEDEATAWHLFVADHTSPAIIAFDLATRRSTLDIRRGGAGQTLRHHRRFTCPSSPVC